MERLKEFSRDGKNFVYIDFSNLKGNDAFLEISEAAETLIAQYPEDSLYTITNIENIRFESNMNRLIARYLEHNSPYVKYGAVIGLDGIKKAMITTILKGSGRDNMFFAFTEEKAVEWLLRQD